jgi:hypothetical protein
MKYGLSGAPVPTALRYADAVNFGAEQFDVSPFLCYAIAYRETIHGEIVGLWPNAATVVSDDGGHGLFQITSPPIPPGWADPYENARWAVQRFIVQALGQWAPANQGDDLVRLVAVTFNAGYGNAKAGHEVGNVDLYSTNDYGAGVLAYYHALVNGTDLEAVAS